MHKIATADQHEQAPSVPDVTAQRWMRAIKHSQWNLEFFYDMVVYLAISALLALVWTSTGASYFWPIFLILAWGVLWALHSYAIYRRNAMTSARVEHGTKRLT